VARDLELAGNITRAEKPMKILFVCTANICRSPMAEEIFNALAEDRKLPWHAESAGVVALEGEPMAPKASEALEEAGIYTKGHRARQVSQTMLEEADLVLAMTPRHVAELRRLFGGSSYKVYSLPEYAKDASSEEGIADPYGYSMSAFRTCVRQLFGYLDQVVDRIER
jgi:protein-tyrosine-phosphatase